MFAKAVVVLAVGVLGGWVLSHAIWSLTPEWIGASVVSAVACVASVRVLARGA